MENSILTVNIDFKLLRELGFNVDNEFRRTLIARTLMYVISQFFGTAIANAIAKEVDLADETNKNTLLRELVQFVNGIDEAISIEESEDSATIMFKLPPVLGDFAHIFAQLSYSVPIIVAVSDLLEERIFNSEKFKKYLTPNDFELDTELLNSMK